MEPSRFDLFTRQVVAASSRRPSRREVLAAASAVLLGRQLVAGSTPARVRAANTVPVGGACGASADCLQADMQRGAICADNGFATDGATNCCLEQGCCQSDADCCGNRRCAVTSDVCYVCMPPPVPTRVLNQLCSSNADCVQAPSLTIACVSGRCTCTAAVNGCPQPTAGVPDLPLSEAAMVAANQFSYFEVAGQLDNLYAYMHPDAQAFIPRATIVGWFSENVPIGSALPATSRKVRFIDWTWPVTGVTYRNTAEVAFDQVSSDGRTVRDVVRLVQDQQGNWRWFFGRDRAFVEAQIARFGR